MLKRSNVKNLLLLITKSSMALIYVVSALRISLIFTFCDLYVFKQLTSQNMNTHQLFTFAFVQLSRNVVNGFELLKGKKVENNDESANIIKGFLRCRRKKFFLPSGEIDLQMYINCWYWNMRRIQVGLCLLVKDLQTCRNLRSRLWNFLSYKSVSIHNFIILNKSISLSFLS